MQPTEYALPPSMWRAVCSSGVWQWPCKHDPQFSKCAFAGFMLDLNPWISFGPPSGIRRNFVTLYSQNVIFLRLNSFSDPASGVVEVDAPTEGVLAGNYTWRVLLVDAQTNPIVIAGGNLKLRP